MLNNQNKLIRVTPPRHTWIIPLCPRLRLGRHEQRPEQDPLFQNVVYSPIPTVGHH